MITWEIIANINLAFKQTLDDGTATGCDSNGADFLSDLLALNKQHCSVESSVYWGIMSLYMVLPLVPVWLYHRVCAHRGDPVKGVVECMFVMASVQSALFPNFIILTFSCVLRCFFVSVFSQLSCWADTPSLSVSVRLTNVGCGGGHLLGSIVMSRRWCDCSKVGAAPGWLITPDLLVLVFKLFHLL